MSALLGKLLVANWNSFHCNPVKLIKKNHLDHANINIFPRRGVMLMFSLHYALFTSCLGDDTKKNLYFDINKKIFIKTVPLSQMHDTIYFF